MPAERQTALEFPLRGIDTSTEFQLQPAGTAAAGENVRSQDPLAELFRGGSRHGLSKLVGDRVNGRAAVQNLAVLYTASREAVNTDYESTDPRSLPSRNPEFAEGVDWVTDPSTNNNAAGLGDRNPNGDRAVPAGGSGRPHVRPPTAPEQFCRTYHVAPGFEESFSDVTICSSYEFPYDFTFQAGGNGGTYVAPGPAPPSLAQLVSIIQAADENDAEPYDDFTDVPE